MRLFRCLILGALGLWAQGPGRIPVQSFGRAQGLTPPYVLSLAQDEQGYILAGTDEGLFRGDGDRFERIPGLPRDCEVFRLLPAPGRIWVGTTKGLAVWEEGRLRRYGAPEGLPPGGVLSLGLDSSGALWIVGDQRPFVSRDGRRFEPDPAWPAAAKMLSLSASPDGSLLALRAEGSLWEHRPGEAWTLRATLPRGWGGLEVVKDGEGWIWAMAEYATLGLAPESHRWESPRLPRPRGRTYRLLRTPTGQVYLACGFGFFELRGGKSGVAFPALIPSLPEHGIRAYLVDREGAQWVGGDGAHRALGRGRVRVYGQLDGLPSESVWCLQRDDQGRLWAATSGGLALGTGAGWRKVDGYSVNSLEVAPDGTLWAGGGNLVGAILHVDPHTLRVTRVRFPEAKSARFSKGFLVEQGALWAASSEAGLWRLDRGQWQPIGPAGPHSSHGTFLHRDREGRIWYGYDGGVQVFDQGTWKPVPGVLPVLTQGMAVAPDGTVAVYYLAGTKVTFHRVEGDQPVHLGTLDHLPEDAGLVVYSGAFDEGGHLWLGCNHGLAEVDPGRGLLAWWGRAEGFPGEDCNQEGLRFEPGGVLWVSTSSGLVRIQRGETLTGTLSTPLLQQALQNGSMADLTTPLRLRAGSDTLELAFFHPAYSLRTHMRWEAQVDLGPWRSLPAPHLVLGGFDPGAHNLRVRARLEEGQPSPALQLNLEVLPQWWQTWVARGAFLALALLLLWGLTKQRSRALERRNALLEAEVEARTQALRYANTHLERMSQAKSLFLANMSHELRTPLNAILLYGDLIRDQAMDLGAAQLQEDVNRVKAAGQHLLSVVNGILDLSKIEAGKMEVVLASIDLSVLLLEVQSTMAPLAADKGVAFKVESPPDPPSLSTDETKLRQILINLCGNAVKFTEAGLISILLRAEDDGWSFEVSDTGPGMTAEQMGRLFQDYEQAEGGHTAQRYGGTGLGLALSRRLAELLGGRLDVRSELGKGSTFRLWLPKEPVSAPIL